jgi:alpha-D-xyloside xylohydrolase
VHHATTPEPASVILRRVTNVATTAQSVSFDLDAYPAVQLPDTPGWLTGETLQAQGVEVTMPNLPALELPELTPTPWRLQVSIHGPRTARIVAAPKANRIFNELPGWLGIVTNDEALDLPPITDTETQVTIAGDNFSVILTKFPLTLRVVNADGRTVLQTGEKLRQVAGFPMAPPLLSVAGRTGLNLELQADEDILGFGEQFGRLIKNGQRLTLRTEDALGTGTGLAYKPVPVWHSTSGYTGFLNTGAIITADVAHQRPSVLSLELDDEVLDLFIFIDDDPTQRLADYVELTGKAQVPPVWAFGYWMGRCRYNSADEMMDVARTMNSQGIPCDVLHLDPAWLVVDRLNTDFIWNESRFGPRTEFIKDLAGEGKRLSVWELPYVDPASPIFAELEERGYLVSTAEGTTAHISGTPTPDGRVRGLIDFSNPDARKWWQEQHVPFLEDGVAVFKTDFGEGFPENGQLGEDTPQTHHHNLYPLRYNSATSEAITQTTKRNALVWGRSGWAGSHRYPGQWGGDAESTVAGMQATVRGGLSYALSAPGFWSHDIGGFFGPELTDALYVRWTQLGAFSPLMRAHGLRPREPWAFGDEALNLSRQWIRRRYELLPYLWQVAHEATASGLPIMSPLHLRFPRDPVATGIDSQFMLGHLMVIPVFDDQPEPTSRTFYVPEGTWQDIYRGTMYEGPRFYTETLDLGTMPVLAQGGTSIPMVHVDDTTRNTDELLARPWTIHTFGEQHGVTADLVDFSGNTVQVNLQAGTSTTPLVADVVHHEA